MDRLIPRLGLLVHFRYGNNPHVRVNVPHLNLTFTDDMDMYPSMKLVVSLLLTKAVFGG